MSFTVYKSSAGSGKTFTLVREYIRLAVKKPDQFRHILAITFTNKAANEMKERVLRYLTDLCAEPVDTSTQSYKFLLPDLMKDTGFSEMEIAAKSRQVLDSILHHYSDFAIGTIDSFVHKIIRTFAHDLKLPLNFEVEMDTDRLLSEAIDLLLNKAGSDEALTRALVEFAEAKTDDEKSWHIEQDLHNFAKQLFKEDNLIHIEKIRKLSIQDFIGIRKKLSALIDKYEKEIIAIAAGACKLMEDFNIPVSAFYFTKSGIGQYFYNLAGGNMDKIHGNSRIMDTIENDKWYGGKITPDMMAGIDSIKDQLRDAWLKISALAEKQHKHYLLHTLIYANLYPLTVLNEIEKVIDEIKKEDNILPISEFNRRISNIIIAQPVPFIYERLGEKYQHYLVDEFQDTSTLQWMNLLPLIENSLSYGLFNMIVGDGKQAIYRWRGGDVEQFAMLPDLPKVITDEFSLQRAEAIKRNYVELSLSSNFRSKAEIIDFNNKFFTHIASISSEYIQSIYAGITQTFNPENTGGCVQIEFMPPENVDGKNYDDANLSRIEEILEENQQHNYALSDIAILCRSNGDASFIARYLTEKGINVLSEESLLIAGSQEVGLLLVLANIVVNVDDDIARYHVLHYLISNGLVKDSDIFITCKNLRSKNKNKPNNFEQGNFNEYLQQNNYSFDPALLSSLPVYELFEELISIFNLNKLKDPYIRFFLDAVHEFSSGKKNNIPAFLEWWDEQKGKKSIIIPEGLNAVRIMTIHKSKGLEFPVVIYPYAHERFRHTNDSLWIHTELEGIPELESALVSNKEVLTETDYAELYLAEKDKSLLDLLNVLYVALTRPSERLYILTKKLTKEAEIPVSIPDFLSSYLKSIGEWKDEPAVYTFGEMLDRPTKKGESDNAKGTLLKDFPIRKRKQIIHLRKKSTDAWDAEDPLRNSEWGNLVHYALSQIDHAGNAEKVIGQMVKKGMIIRQEEERLTDKIKRILDHEEIKQYFQPGCQLKTEAEILLKDGSTARPDRVIIEGNKAVVMDYKTGGKKEWHKEQIALYADILREMGYIDVKKMLVYVDHNEVMVV